MIFGKLQEGRCINVLLFENEQTAHEFDNTLVEVQEGYGIGDEYINGTWRHHTPTDEERIAQIHEELEKLDKEISRGLEDLYELTGKTPYQRLQYIIEIKQDLREELRELGGE